MVRRRWRNGAVGVLLAVSLGCTAQPPGEPEARPEPTASTTPGVEEPAPPTATASLRPPRPSRPPGPPRFDAKAAFQDVRLLAGRIGPRLATAPAFRRATRVVVRRFEHLGYDVEVQTFPVPAGDSWGVPAGAGRSANVVAAPEGFDPRRPHRLVGAHLDTVAVAPGAEDNASGVAVLLDLARLAAAQDPVLPTVFVAFGAEEPRGPGDELHHFGSRHYVATMPARQRRGLRAMVSLDRVGVGRVVPVCTGPLSPPVVRRQLLAAAARVGVPATACANTASDHWSFEKAGHAVARLGSTSYAAYHSAADLPAVVDRAQLGRTGRLAWAWLSGPGPGS